MSSKIVLLNRPARHDYHIEETFIAGMVLEGWEVKAILAGRANFNGGGAFIRLRNSIATLEGMTITPLAHTDQGLLVPRDPHRSKVLLLNKVELAKLARKVVLRGYTLVPLAVLRERKLKLELGVAKGKALPDKRLAKKEQDLQRDAARQRE